MSGGELILIVEDNREIRALVCSILQEYGFRVIEAYSGWKALQLAESMPPDLLLLDWQLPDISGLDVLRALRAGRCHSPAILMTGYGSEELAIVALRLGVCDYLRKPFEPEELIGAVEAALTETRLRRECELLAAQLAQATRRLDEDAPRKAHVTSLLERLAQITDELRRGKTDNWTAQVDEARKYILQIAEAIEVRQQTPKHD